jgi:hypothetical protein
MDGRHQPAAPLVLDGDDPATVQGAVLDRGESTEHGAGPIPSVAGLVPEMLYDESPVLRASTESAASRPRPNSASRLASLAYSSSAPSACIRAVRYERAIALRRAVQAGSIGSGVSMPAMCADPWVPAPQYRAID